MNTQDRILTSYSFIAALNENGTCHFLNMVDSF